MAVAGHVFPLLAFEAFVLVGRCLSWNISDGDEGSMVERTQGKKIDR
jgi:hypothetical protein